MLNRRIFLKFLTGLPLAVAVHSMTTTPAWAEDGGHDSDGHDSDGHDSDGHDNDGRDNDGRDDDGRDDDGGNDDGGKDDGGKSGKRKGLDQDDALRELKKGKIIPLKTALKIVDAKVGGKVIDIALTKTLGRSQYRIKIRRDNGSISTIRLDARTGSFVGMLGF